MTMRKKQTIGTHEFCLAMQLKLYELEGHICELADLAQSGAVAPMFSDSAASSCSKAQQNLNDLCTLLAARFTEWRETSPVAPGTP